MITTSSTLFRYISRQFLTNLLLAMLILCGILMLLETIEILRRASNMQNELPFATVLIMPLLKLPSLAERVMPMGVLFAAIYTCWKLNKTSELVVIRSFGISAWQFLTPLVLCAVLVGVASTTVINPISSVFLAKRIQMENVYFLSNTNLTTVSKTGIWLRQPTPEGYALVHAATLNRTDWQLNDIIALFFDNDDNFLKRYDGPIANLEDGFWAIRDATVNDKAGTTTKNVSLRLPTELTAQKIEESFSDPETTPFWSIPEYIKIMEDTGLPTIRLYLHFNRLLAQPLLYAAMILLAAALSLRPPRMGGVAFMTGLSIAVGFSMFFLQSLLEAFGLSQKIPIYLAAWSPSLIGLLLGGTALLHLEDG